MSDYKEFQFGWILPAVLIPVQLLVTYLYLNNLGDRPLPTNGFIAFTVIGVATYLLFYGMHTRVTNEFVIIAFGIGLIKKKIQLTRITSVETVNNKWYYGWGIRLIPNGWLWNISGLKGVELRFHDTNRVFRIGSQQPKQLADEINKRK